jgi:hypothetical protein
MMAFPKRTYGVNAGLGTTPLVYTMMMSYIRQHLPSAPR